MRTKSYIQPFASSLVSFTILNIQTSYLFTTASKSNISSRWWMQLNHCIFHTCWAICSWLCRIWTKDNIHISRLNAKSNAHTFKRVPHACFAVHLAQKCPYCTWCIFGCLWHCCSRFATSFVIIMSPICPNYFWLCVRQSHSIQLGFSTSVMMILWITRRWGFPAPAPRTGPMHLNTFRHWKVGRYFIMTILTPAVGFFSFWYLFLKKKKKTTAGAYWQATYY